MNEYVCSKCGVANVKLWRQYQTFACHTRLLCASCAEKDQGKPKGYALCKGSTDQIGWLVPAVPIGDTYWGYTSVPKEGVDWWNSLRDRPLTEV
jgi:hypothetical protein